ncbi:hypothetical protein AB0P21_05850 [Kribbella sp. NPDC056861]|uniref:hypothetical protein n=1 Tax=Kribbella sp. NPDC056861 TaxID=3154857 RepID=UPI00343D083E
MKTYEAAVTREGRWWMIEIPELDGLTQARRLDEVEKMAHEYVAVTLDVPMSQVAVAVSGIEVAGQDLLEAKMLVDDLRRQAQQLEVLVAELARGFATAMTSAGVPVRDVGTVLGVSHQRVSQLVQAEPATQTTELAQLVQTAKAASKVAGSRNIRVKPARSRAADRRAAG